MAGHLRCADCGAEHRLDTAHWRCPGCCGPFSYEGPAPAFPQDRIARRPASMWRYAEALPPLAAPLGLGEPLTPLVQSQIGGRRVLFKCDYCMPSGSYKDRGAALLANQLKANGVEAAVEDSSGNAGAALAAYAARLGIALKVFCPASTSPGKLAQIRLYGAQTVKVEGPRARATEALLEHVEQTGAYYASHLWHPFFIEGIQTLAYEIAEQLDWRAPDAVACPTGAGSILLGLYKGFEALRQAGVIDRLPRLVAVQSRRVAPLYEAFKAGAATVAPASAPQPTLAEGIALPAPVRGAQVLQSLRASDGAVITVSEEEIIYGLKALGARGFCVEPTSAVVWKGVERYLEQTDLTEQATVVAVLSGHGLKAASALPDLLDADRP